MSRSWHAIEIEEAMKQLGPKKTGLSHEEARNRFREFEPNELKAKKRITQKDLN